MLVNILPTDILLNIYSYIGPKLLYINNIDLLSKIKDIKKHFKDHGICIYYKITSNTHRVRATRIGGETISRIYISKQSFEKEQCTYIHNIYIGELTNINTIYASKNLKEKLLPDQKWEYSNLRHLTPQNATFDCIKYDFEYVKVDNIKEFRNYQLVWKKYI